MMSMASLSVLHASQAPFAPFLTGTTRFAGAFPAKAPSLPLCRRPSRAAALKSPRGFGPAPARRKAGKKQRKRRGGVGDDEDEDEVDDEEDEEEGDVGYEDDGTIPEVVTNRMMRRMGVSVGAPLAVGLLFFPFFYYLKVVGKVDVPTWVPFLVSFFFFGTALLGISYGIVSSSWDPLREGSLLGWNEAQRNWPVFWQSLWSGRGDDRSGRRGGDSRKSEKKQGEEQMDNLVTNGDVGRCVLNF